MADRPKWTPAPKGYRQEWQFAPRVSGLPFGAFEPPWWKRLRWLAIVVALIVLWATSGPVMDELIRWPQ